ncbi:MAG: peptidoglycan-binding protein [Beijerinckiaceae bacterium]|nr:peptidoglycan-binding protein [Beijerinckiaceae bacterium]
MSPSEMAFLWKWTEKWYDSWPVRSLFWLMVAAPLLAGGSLFFVGGQTVQLRQNLETIARNAVADMQAARKATQEELERHSRDLNEMLAKAEQSVQALEGRTDKLKAQAVEGLVVQLRKDMSADLSRLKSEIERLQSSIKQLTAEVNGSREQLNVSQAKLQSIIQFTKSADDIAGKAGKIQEAHSSAIDELGKTRFAREAAEVSAREAERKRNEVSGIVGPLELEALAYHRNLATIQERLKSLRERMTKAQDEIATGEIRSRYSTGTVGGREPLDPAARGQVRLYGEYPTAAATGREALGLTEPPRDQGRLSSENSTGTVTGRDGPGLTKLTRVQWRQVQMSLNKILKSLNQELVPADGKPGRKTRDAIKTFQMQNGAPATGHLTPEQVASLLAT